MKIPELLAPAGSRESLYAAVACGCDAVYLGGKNYSARSSAENFDSSALDEIMDYCHIRNVKVYVTVNTLYKNEELNGVIDFCEKAYKAGADAFIMQDIGAAFFIRRNFPGIKLFAGTQMTVGNALGVEFLSEYFDRVILARETPIEMIREITKTCSAESEVFAHGALCVCHSGQCLMSSVIGERSGNRGKCAQPCRMKYDLVKGNEVSDSGYLLSPRDLCTLSVLPELVECGVDSIKIEGRMKSPEYTALATLTYRTQLDKIASGNTSVDNEALRKLTQIFNRGGSFTPGYFHKYGGHSMMSTETPKSTGVYVGEVVSFRPAAKKAVIRTETDLVCGDGIEVWTRTGPHTGAYINSDFKAGSMATVEIEGRILSGDKVYKSFDKRLADELKKLSSPNADSRKISVDASVHAKTGEQIILRLMYEDISVEMKGAVCLTADNRPMSAEAIKTQLSKTGGTTFEFNFNEVITDENLFIGLKDLNELRRKASEALKEEIIKSKKRELSVVKINRQKLRAGKSPAAYPELTAHVHSFPQLEAVINAGVKRIIFESYISFRKGVAEAIQAARAAGVKVYAALPKTICAGADEYSGQLNDIITVDGYLLRYFGHIPYFSEKGVELIADHSFNAFNSLSQEFLLNAGFNRVTLSPELNLNQIREIAGPASEVIIHGRLPLMVTNQCSIGNTDETRGEKNKLGRFCKHRGSEGYALRDGLGLEFPIITDCVNCVAQILNSKPVFTLNKLEDICGSGAGSFRLVFTTESGEDTEALTRAYIAKLSAAVDAQYPGLSESAERIDDGILLKQRRSDVNEANRLISDILNNSAVYEGVTNGHFYRGVL